MTYRSQRSPRPARPRPGFQMPHVQEIRPGGAVPLPGTRVTRPAPGVVRAAI